MTPVPAAHPSTIGPRRRRGRPTALTRARIGDAAVEVGFVNLTMVAVAAKLGVTHTALYGHVADRDDLVLAAAERVADSIRWATYDGEWRTFLETEGFAMWDAFIEHPGLMNALEATGRLPRSVLERFGSTCQVLVDHGFDPSDATLAVDTVYDLAIDASSRSARHRELDILQKQAMADELSEPLSDALRAEVRAAVTGAARDWFARKLTLVLDGIETRRRTVR